MKWVSRYQEITVPRDIRTEHSFNPIAYGILRLSQLRGGGGGGGRIFIPHSRKQYYDYLIDLKFGTDNSWYKTIKNTRFQKICCSIYRDITSWRSSLHEGTIDSVPMFKNGFSNPKLYFLHTSAIFNKKKKFHVFNFVNYRKQIKYCGNSIEIFSFWFLMIMIMMWCSFKSEHEINFTPTHLIK